MFREWSLKRCKHDDERNRTLAWLTGENFDKWWAGLSTERWGYLTLRRLAIECNPRVLWTEPVDRAWEILFKNEILERKATVDVCNERFLNFNITLNLNLKKLLLVFKSIY